VTEGAPRLPARPRDGHKGTFGTLGVVGGCCSGAVRMIGAPALSALGALRAGAGLVRLVMPEPILSAGLVVCPGATGRPLPVESEGEISAGLGPPAFDAAIASCGAVVIGPGLGEGAMARALTLRAVQQETPVVVDADGLNALAATPELWRDFRAPAVLTPHPGEFRRLAAALRITLDPVQPQTRPDAASALAQRLGCVVVLKGAGTVVSDGHATWVCDRGHPCLGTAGTGDVLSGVIGALIVQHAIGPKPALSIAHAARLGVEAHAIAGELWAQSHSADAGLLATELAALIPEALQGLRAG